MINNLKVQNSEFKLKRRGIAENRVYDTGVPVSRDRKFSLKDKGVQERDF
jgi:hypothetical protein